MDLKYCAFNELLTLWILMIASLSSVKDIVQLNLTRVIIRLKSQVLFSVVVLGIFFKGTPSWNLLKHFVAS
jgi:hypothetical protein